MDKKSLDKQFKKQTNRIEKILDELNLDIQLKEIKRPTLKTIENLKTINKSSLTSYLKGDSSKTKNHKNIKTYLLGINLSQTKTKVSSTKPKQTKTKVSSTKPKQTKRKSTSTKPKQTKNKVSSTKPKQTKPKHKEYTSIKTEVLLVDDTIMDITTGEELAKINKSDYLKNNEIDYDKLSKDYNQYDFVSESDFYDSYDYLDTERVIDDRLEEILSVDSKGSDIITRFLSNVIAGHGKTKLYDIIASNQEEFFQRLDRAVHYGSDNDDVDTDEFKVNFEAIQHMVIEELKKSKDINYT